MSHAARVWRLGNMTTFQYLIDIWQTYLSLYAHNAARPDGGSSEGGLLGTT